MISGLHTPEFIYSPSTNRFSGVSEDTLLVIRHGGSPLNSTAASIQTLSTAFKDLGSKQGFEFHHKQTVTTEVHRTGLLCREGAHMYELIQHPSNSAVRIEIQQFYSGVFSYLGEKAVGFFPNKIKNGKYVIQTVFIL